jgi:hypothetical protein
MRGPLKAAGAERNAALAAFLAARRIGATQRARELGMQQCSANCAGSWASGAAGDRRGGVLAAGILLFFAG